MHRWRMSSLVRYLQMQDHPIIGNIKRPKDTAPQQAQARAGNQKGIASGSVRPAIQERLKECCKALTGGSVRPATREVRGSAFVDFCKG